MQKSQEMLELGFKFHGHKCPAMPLGIRVGLAALKALGVERAGNKELFCILENGPAHATMCFGDGVQIATGCTFGKGNITRLNHGKNAITLIDLKTGRAVRVTLNKEFQKKGLESEFVKLRQQGIEPKDIPPQIVDPLIERIWSAPDEDILVVGKITTSNFKPPRGTFEWVECARCGEVTFGHGIRLENGELVCYPCSRYAEAS